MEAFVANRAAFVALALVLVGCTSGGTFGWLEQYGTDFESAFDYGAGGRDFSTVVVGNPFGGDAAVFGRSVASTLTARNTFQPINFTTDPGPSARLQYRLVLLFNSERGGCRDRRRVQVERCRYVVGQLHVDRGDPRGR
ncbi:MAG: hypothetical protein V3R75_01770 [Alphaproteobacteria bacterium]